VGEGSLGVGGGVVCRGVGGGGVRWRGEAQGRVNFDKVPAVDLC
jgi:hypothetical protein